MSFEMMCETCTNEMQTALAKSAVKCMLRKQDEGAITRFHRVAMMLHPNMRQLNCVVDSEEKYQEVLEKCR